MVRELVLSDQVFAIVNGFGTPTHAGVVEFLNSNGVPDLFPASGATAWNNPRMVYLQHASDPIVWWSPRLIVSRPEWLAEPRGRDVSPSIRWIPFVTFWQVTADMAFSTEVPAGHGHNYGPSAVPAWADIIPPQGWTPGRTAELTPIIASSGD